MGKKGFTPLQILKDSLLAGCILRSKDSSKKANSHKKFVMGFTLLEVLIVVIIIGILAAISLPQYTATLEKSKSGEASSNIGSIRTAIDRYWYQNGSFPASLDVLDIDDPNDVTNRLYNYTIGDTGTSSDVRAYTVTAERVGAATTWVKWTQTDNNTGKLTRSANLGGPTS